MSGKFYEEGKQFFDAYSQKLISTADEDISENLLLKKEHSLRVAQLCASLANKLELNEQECELAGLIGLLHDLGRFTQFEKHKSFDDSKTEDHALLGIAIIKEQAFFLNLSEDEQQNIVVAIESHNKLFVNSKDKQTTTMWGQILRDADKLDIWELCVLNLKRDGSFNLSSISYNLPKAPSVSESIIKNLLTGKPVLKKDLQSVNDFKLMLIAMVYDLNYKASFHMLNEKQLISKIYDSLPKRDDVIDAYRQVRLFIENKFVE